VEDPPARASALAFAKSHAIDALYLQLASDYAEPAQFEGLSTLSRAAQAQGMTLRWVEGRAEWALPENHTQAVAALAQAAQINTQLMAAGRPPIRAMVYDVEPWALPEWEDDAANLISGYVAMVEALHEASTAAGIELWMALPFWFEQEAAKNAPDAESVLERADGVLIMAYRDNAQDIEQAARPMLEHATSLQLPVIVGVETKCVSPSFISFCDAGEAALVSALRELRARFDKDRSVVGFAVHELSSWRALDGS
jgi:hypothetical protein